MGADTDKLKESRAAAYPAVAAPVAEPIRLYVPESLGDLAESNLDAYRLPVEIERYKRFGKNLIDQVQEKRVICIASMEDFAKYFNSSSTGEDGAQLMGKWLLVTASDGDKAIAVTNPHGLDLVAKDAPPDVWTFKINKALAEIEYDRQIDTIREGDYKKGRDLDTLSEIGMALSTEKDLDKLLDMIVSKCREMTWADGGSLYFIETDPNIPEDREDYFANKKMRFRVAQNFSRDIPFQSFLVDVKKSSINGYVGITQKSLNLEDAYFLDSDAEYNWGGREFDAAIGYRTMSMLTVPMVNYREETIGVIQLINRKVDPNLVLGDPESCVEHITPFTGDDERMAMSIASQASIAIQNAQLVEDIKGLFNGFINASVKAIESRDPTTSGHSQRVALLTVAIAEAVDQASDARFGKVKFTYENLQELRYASLLHDFGKIGVRENVLVKAKKLYPDEKQSVLDRFDLIRSTTEVEHMSRQLEHLLAESKDQALVLVDKTGKEMEAQLKELEEALEFILKCNEPTVLAEGGFEQLNEIAAKNFRKRDGAEAPFLTEKELISLSVRRGSLNENDRKEIESHVTHTYKFLSQIPWTADLRNVAEIAYAHHEKLDGSGYPNKLNADQIPLGSKMMTVADIYDALTAWDRPYKKAVPVERALNILVEESNAGHIDKELLEIFITKDLYKLVETRE